MSRRVSKGDVHWYAPGRKSPVAYSTVATSRGLGLLAEAGHTFDSARAHVPFDREAATVLDAYIALGYGGRAMADVGVIY